MALHRDIYWVGKQWAVTGHGIQACNQKQKGQFDIEASRLWEDGVQDAVRALSWVNMEDFEKAITAARKYYPEPSRLAKPELDMPECNKPELDIECDKPKFDMRFEGVPAKLRPVWRIRIRGDGRPNQ